MAQARFENHIQTQSTSQWFPQQCCRAKNSLKLYHKVLGLHILPEFTYETIWPHFKLSPFITEINNITCLLKKNTLYVQSFCGLKKMVEIPFSCLTRRKHHWLSFCCQTEYICKTRCWHIRTLLTRVPITGIDIPFHSFIGNGKQSTML